MSTPVPIVAVKKRKADPSSHPLFRSTQATTQALNSLKMAKTNLKSSPSLPLPVPVPVPVPTGTAASQVEPNAFISAFDSLPFSRTENGAGAFSSTGDNRLDYFYSALVRGADKDKVSSLMSRSWSTSPESTLKLLMHSRDCRHGKGERLVSLYSLLWLRQEKPMTYLLNFPLFLSFGYFKDILQLCVLLEEEERKTGAKFDRMGEKAEWVELEIFSEFLKSDAKKMNKWEAKKKEKESQENETRAKAVVKESQAEAKVEVKEEKSTAEAMDVADDWVLLDEGEDTEETEEEGKESVLLDLTVPPAVPTSSQARVEEETKIKLGKTPHLSLSLASKWAPGENHAFDKSPHHLAHRLARILYPTSKKEMKNYRRLLTYLRGQLSLVERLMCAGQWSEINFSSVPARAHQKLKKAFMKHEKERYGQYLASLKKGDPAVKIATTGLQPHELIRSYAAARGEVEVDETVEAAWKDLVAKLKAKGTLSSAVSVVDVSGSMTSGSGSVRPLDAALALGLLVAELTAPPFAHRFLTFDSQPTWHILHPTDSLAKKVRSSLDSPWGGSTDLLATFELILTLAVTHKIPVASMPSTLFIFSDMQFNQATQSPMSTIFDVVKSKYQTAGYPVPAVVFWNLNGRYDNMPVRMDENNVCLLSGFSGELLHQIMEGGKLDPIIMLEKVMKPYEQVQVAEVER